MAEKQISERARALRKQLLVPTGPSEVYALYNGLFGAYPDWNLSPYQVIDAIVSREEEVRATQRQAEAVVT